MRDDRRREQTPREVHRQRRKEQIQRRRLVAGLCLLGLIILIVVLATTCGGGGGQTTTTTTGKSESTSTTLTAAEFTADLSSEDSDATGALVMNYDPEAEELSFELTVDALKGPSAATIYAAADDGSGTAVYTLFAGPAEEGDYSGVLAQGTVDEAALTGSLEGGTLGDLIALIRSGDAYVSVGTSDVPVDAIRGQFEETTTGTGGTGSSGTTETTQKTTTTTAKGSSKTTKTTAG